MKIYIPLIAVLFFGIPSFGFSADEKTTFASFNIKCMDIPYGSSAPNTALQAWTCNMEPQQYFRATYKGVYNGRIQYELKNEASGKCLDIPFGQQQNGARVVQYDCNGSQTQLFSFGFGRYLDWPGGLRSIGVKVISLLSGKCLDFDRGAPQDGAAVQQWECLSNDNQIFFIDKDFAVSVAIYQ
jgi:hypothetical protein